MSEKPFNNKHPSFLELEKDPEKFRKIECFYCKEKRNTTTLVCKQLCKAGREGLHISIPVGYDEIECYQCNNTGFLYAKRKNISGKNITIFIVPKNGERYPSFTFKISNNFTYEDELDIEFNEIKQRFRNLGFVNQDIIYIVEKSSVPNVPHHHSEI